MTNTLYENVTFFRISIRLRKITRYLKNSFKIVKKIKMNAKNVIFIQIIKRNYLS